MANRMLMVTIVKPIAISGEIRAMVFDRSVRFSSTSCMNRFLLVQTASAHQQPQLLTVSISSRERLREVAVKHHSDTVGDFGEFVQVLARHEYGGAAWREIEQSTPDDRRGACLSAPGPFGARHHSRLPQES